MIDPEFIERAREHVMNDPEYYKCRHLDAIRKWNNNNREQLRSSRKVYEKTEKGKLASKRRNCIRHRRFRELVSDLTLEELEGIKEFYCHCPEDWHVDHIIPISKGGKHLLSNLQYLPALENLKKGAKLDWAPNTARNS